MRPVSLILTVGVIFGFAGSIIGALWLAEYWGLPLYPVGRLIMLHPYLQFYGFTVMVLTGVSYLTLHRLRNVEASSPYVAYAAFTLLAAGNIGLSLDVFFRASPTLLNYILLLAGGLLYVGVILNLQGVELDEVAAGGGYLRLGLALLTLLLFTPLLALSSIPPMFILNNSFLKIALLGFSTAMVFGVELNTVQTPISSGVRVALFTLAAASLSAIGEFFVFGEESPIAAASSTLYLLGGALFTRSIHTFRRFMVEGDSGLDGPGEEGYRYTARCFKISHLWLLLGLILGLARTLFDITSPCTPYGLRDSFIHAVAIGFVGVSIMGFGHQLLPAATGRRAGEGMSLKPVYLVSFGVAVRVVGDILIDFTGRTIWPVGLSGFFILTGMVYFLAAPYLSKERDTGLE